MDETTRIAAQQFAADTYATETTGIVLEKADRNYARCRLDAQPRHMNANGQVMGGAIFTLADFTFAVAANGGGMETPTVTLASQIQFLGTMKGSSLIAETVCLKAGRGTCVMEIEVRDDTGVLIAKATSTGYRLSR